MFTVTDNLDQNHTTAALFKNAVKRAGLNLEPFDPASVPAPEFTPATPKEIGDAVYKAATGGKDPSTDKEVQRLLMSKLLGDQIGGLHHRNELAKSRAELEHYQAQAPALLEELKAKLNDAVTTMKEAIPVIGHLELSDGLRSLGNMSDRKAAAVATAHAANSRTPGIIEAHRTISEAAGKPLPPNVKWGRLSYTAPTLAQFNNSRLDSRGTVNNHGRQHNVWDMLNDGITVELADGEEFKARVERIEQAVSEQGRNLKAEASQQSEAKAQARAMGF